ncbi:hypothetical protein BC830DRAFT_1194769 [Chytriomyces sp. MP71]|nr:hypothetical protein BC830DRAFT_1194769 [Chytriomyces sp. MP71]
MSGNDLLLITPPKMSSSDKARFDVLPPLQLRGKARRREGESIVANKVVMAAKRKALERKASVLLTNEDLDLLWDTLWAHASSGTEEKRRMTYDDFKQVKGLLPEKFHRFMSAGTFLHFGAEDDGSILVVAYFNYVLRKVSLMQTRLDFAAYDHDNDGFLTDAEMEMFVLDMIQKPEGGLKIGSLNETVVPFYVMTAVRRFAFFLDPMRRGKLSIQKILLSPILTQFYELRDEIDPEYLRDNWFAPDVSLRVYETFLDLDVDRNGFISRDEMRTFYNGTLTEPYLDRLYAERGRDARGLDFKGFVDFVIALENPAAPESVAWQFKLLDVESKNVLDEFVLKTLFKGVVDKMIHFQHEAPNVEDVVNEVFDMANGKRYHEITLEDLVKCGVGGTITTILTDCRGFWACELPCLFSILASTYGPS